VEELGESMVDHWVSVRTVAHILVGFAVVGEEGWLSTFVRGPWLRSSMEIEGGVGA
jgi:hypothetical protein